MNVLFYRQQLIKRILWGLILIGLLFSFPLLNAVILDNRIQIQMLQSIEFQNIKNVQNICASLPQIDYLWPLRKTDIDNILSLYKPYMMLYLNKPLSRFVIHDTPASERAKILAWHIGCAMFNRGETSRAIVIWKNHVPQSSNIFAYQSVAAFDNSNLDNAQSLAAIAEAIDDTPSIEKVKLYNRFCLFSINQQQTQDALIWCRKLAAVSNSDTTQLLMGKAYYLAQDYSSAIEWLSKVQGKEQHDTAIYALADVYIALGQWQKVLEILEQISHPEDKQNLLRATAWLHLGDQEKASLLLRQILKNSPQPAIRQQICQLGHDFQLGLACNE